MRSYLAFGIPALMIFLSFVYGCSSKNQNEEVVMNSLEESLAYSSKVIHTRTEISYRELGQKLLYPATFHRATIWYTKAKLVGELSTDILKHIQKVKDVLKERKENEQIIFSNDQIIELSAALDAYKEKLMVIDSAFRNLFDSTIEISVNSEPTKGRQVFIRKLFFDKMPVYKARVLLSQVENSIYIIENRLAEFCCNKVGIIDDHIDDLYSIIVGQNSNYVKGGEKLEIVAGVGVFSKKCQPVIYINKDSIPVSEDGAAHYIIRAPGRPGKHFIPVTILFTNGETTRRDTINKTVNYTVLDK